MQSIILFVKNYPKTVAAFLLAIMVAVSAGSLLGDSATMDEIAHIPAGYTYLKYQDYRLNPEHPPLIKALAGTPLQFMNLTFPTEGDFWTTAINGQWKAGWSFLYESGNNPDAIIIASRLPLLLVMVLLGVFVYKWTNEMFGKKAALVAMILYAFSPNIIAHSRYVTTDIGATLGIAVALYYYVKFLKTPSWKLAWISMFALSLAQLLKFSDVVLYPIMGIMALAALFLRKENVKKELFFSWLFKGQSMKKIAVYLGSLLFIFGGSLVVITAVYHVFLFGMPIELQQTMINHEFPLGTEKETFNNMISVFLQSELTRGFAHYLLGLFMVIGRVSGGNTTYFLGETTNQSFRYFYPIAILIKTPIATLITTALSSIAIFTVWKKALKNHKKNLGDKALKIKNLYALLKKAIWNNLYVTTAIGVIALFLGTGILGNLNIGLRHIIIIYPFWFMLLAGAIVYIVRSKKGVQKIATVMLFSILGIWYISASMVTYPGYLSYFNEFIQPPRSAYQYMTDSNLDWGQDLKRLAKYAEENNIEKIHLDYFGGGLPEHYLGDKYIEHRVDYERPRTGWVAVSATFFQNSKYYARVEGKPDYGWLEKLEPEIIIGKSILVYNLDK